MTIAQQLNIKEFPFRIKDSKGNEIYSEDCNGWWTKWEYNLNGKKIYFETSNGFFGKYEYDSDGKISHFENGKIMTNG